MTNRQPQQRYEIGMVGLGVMGCNLVLNMADRGCAEAGYNKDQPKVEGKIGYYKLISVHPVR